MTIVIISNLYAAVVFYRDSNRKTCQIVFSVGILLTCAFNLSCASTVVYEVDDWSDPMATSLSVLQTRVVAVASFASRAVVLYNALWPEDRDAGRRYASTLDGFEIYSPPADATLARLRGRFALVASALVLAVVLPTNAFKVYNLLRRHPDGPFIATYFLFFYLQNLSMCLVENHFADQCFAVYTRFRGINRDLDGVAEAAAAVGGQGRFVAGGSRGFSRLLQPPRRIVYDRDFYRPRAADPPRPLANVIEVLKLRHWLTREAVVHLNRLFGVHLALSVVSLGFQALFDVYIDVFHFFKTDRRHSSIFRSNLLFFAWILQYSIRFGLITVTPSMTINQKKFLLILHSKAYAWQKITYYCSIVEINFCNYQQLYRQSGLKTKILITAMNNRFLDSSTKEELQLFYTQISTHPTQFSVYDLFTLNIRLISSAVAAGATYLVILVEVHSRNNSIQNSHYQAV